MTLLPVSGIRLGTARAGIKYADRRDLVLCEIAEHSSGAAVFTQNAFCAAPVIVARNHLQQNSSPRYLLINTGNANAGTGKAGLADAEVSCQQVAKIAGCQSTEVLPFSTGVIGERLPVDRMAAGIAQAYVNLVEDGWEDAAWGIMTTDTCPKAVSKSLSINDKVITLTGIAKGSGMIRPDMATMLAFIATDATIEQTVLQHCLQQAVTDSFNAITVDGDTSTNDACVLLATGRGDVELQADSISLESFCNLLKELCCELAQEMVRDGEGATKLITIKIEQGQNREECRQLAYTIAHSPLVKTAFFASDPNWGRILAAVGRAGLPDLVLENVNIYLDEICIVRHGEKSRDYTEEQGQNVMNRKEITLRVELGRGDTDARIWTTDLSFDYVKINALTFPRLDQFDERLYPLNPV
jgi:glutamate N-acetyltransferase/amino-acid N-acetyltransferase